MHAVNDGKFRYNTGKATVFYFNNSNFISHFYTFFLAGNIFVYTPIQGTNREKYFNHFAYREKGAESGGK